MLSERLKSRLLKDRPMTSITLRIPVDVVESMKAIAPLRVFAGYQTLLNLSHQTWGICHRCSWQTSSKCVLFNDIDVTLTPRMLWRAVPN